MLSSLHNSWQRSPSPKNRLCISEMTKVSGDVDSLVPHFFLFFRFICTIVSIFVKTVFHSCIWCQCEMIVQCHCVWLLVPRKKKGNAKETFSPMWVRWCFTHTHTYTQTHTHKAAVESRKGGWGRVSSAEAGVWRSWLCCHRLSRAPRSPQHTHNTHTHTNTHTHNVYTETSNRLACHLLGNFWTASLVFFIATAVTVSQPKQYCHQINT